MNAKSKKEPIPEYFDSAEQAGTFWDAHSAADYWDKVQEVYSLRVSFSRLPKS